MSGWAWIFTFSRSNTRENRHPRRLLGTGIFPPPTLQPSVYSPLLALFHPSPPLTSDDSTHCARCAATESPQSSLDCARGLLWRSTTTTPRVVRPLSPADNPVGGGLRPRECDPDLSGGWPPLHPSWRDARAPHGPHLDTGHPLSLLPPPFEGGGVQQQPPPAERRRGRVEKREQTRPWLVITWDWRLSGWLLWTCGEGEGVVFWSHCRCASPSFLLPFLSSFEGMRCVLRPGWNYEIDRILFYEAEKDRKGWIITWCISNLSFENNWKSCFFKYFIKNVSSIIYR